MGEDSHPADEDAPKARAARIREQIDRLKGGRPAAPPARPESAREFIERRMRETDSGESEAEAEPESESESESEPEPESESRTEDPDDG